MNINDNKLYELMKKTEKLVLEKARRRKLIAAGALGTFAVAAAVIALSIFLGPTQVPDVTLENPSSFSAANENAETATPLPDGSTQDPSVPTPEPFSKDIWDTWSVNKQANGIDVSVTMDLEEISMPAYTGAIPVLEIKKGKFDLDLAKKAVDYFLGDEYYEYGKTKADYDIELRAAQGLFESLDLSEEEKYQAQRYIDFVESWKKDAPESLEKGKIEFKEENEHERIILRAFAEDASPSLELTNYSEPLRSTFAYLRGNPDRDYLRSAPVMDTYGWLDEEVAKYAAAWEKAREAVEYFTDEMSLKLSVLGYVYDGSLELSTIESHIDYDKAEKCYIFYFTRDYGGITADLDLSPIPYVEDMSVPAPSSYEDIPWRHHNEYISVVVDELGIARFTWLNKTETGKAIQEKADILSLDEAHAIFKEEIFNVDSEYDNRTYGVADPNKAVLNVTQVLLQMVRIESGDGGYLMVPAYTYKGIKSASNHDNFEMLYGNAADYKNLLIINALDGSIIDLS